MRTKIRSLTLAGLLIGTAVAATAADAQPTRRRVVVERSQVEPMRQRRLTAEERAILRERIIQRRELVGGRAGLRAGGRAGLRAGGRAGMRAGAGAGFRAGGRAGMRAGEGRGRDRMIARRAVMRERINNMTPEQRTAMQAQRQAARTERQAVGAELRAGKITREQAQTRLRTWREKNPNPLRPPPKGPGGDF